MIEGSRTTVKHWGVDTTPLARCLSLLAVVLLLLGCGVYSLLQGVAGL